MAKSIPAFINPAMLAWAREKSRLPLEVAAKSIGVSPGRLQAAELGEANLTFPQFLNAAKVYKRAPSIFYLDEYPKDFQPIQDFRKLTEATPGYSPALTVVIRQACERRETALELHDELATQPQEFTIQASLGDNENDLAARIRTFLDVTDTEQRTWRATAFDKWRGRIEAKDVLVFLVPGLPLEEMRGAAIAEALLPVILVNAKDRTNGRIFTLLHEFCHLVLRASGVSGFGSEDGSAHAVQVEKFCNAVAAATLVPTDWLLSERIVITNGSSKTWTDDDLATLAMRFGVSREVILRRLLTLGRTTRDFYQSRRPTFQKEYDDLDKERKSAPIPQHTLALSRLGRYYTKLVFQNYYERHITLRDVCSYLSMQPKNVPAMEQAAFSLGKQQ